MARPTVRKRRLTSKELDWELKERERVSAYRKEYYQKNRERILAQQKKIRDANPDRIKTYAQRNYNKHKGTRISYATQRNRLPCRDPLTGDIIQYSTLLSRKRNHPELYSGIVMKDCLI